MAYEINPTVCVCYGCQIGYNGPEKQKLALEALGIGQPDYTLPDACGHIKEIEAEQLRAVFEGVDALLSEDRDHARWEQ